ncbi:MAG: trigger factor [Patescibacteria group bacterium]
MEVTIEKQPKATLKMTVKVPSDKVRQMYYHVLEEFAKDAEIAGFRKGKAPLELVEKNTKEADLNGEVVNHLLQHYYVAAVKENKVSPIGNPKVTIKKFAKNDDFEFEAVTPTKPEVKLKDYKKVLKELHTEKKAEKKEEFKGLSVDAVIETLAGQAQLEVSDMLIEEEVTRMLARLLQQAETLGLTIEQYLTAQNKSAEDLRLEYQSYALKTLTAEFALAKAIEDENIKVEDSEIEAAINAMPDAAIKEKLQKGQDRWYIVSVLAKNKLISKLLSELDKDPDQSSKVKEEEK